MEEELQKTANEALKGIIEGVASAKDFILAELPEVIQQLLMWEFWSGVIYMSLFGVSCIAFGIISFFACKASKKSEDWKDNVGAVSAMLSFGLFCMSVVSIIFNVPKMIQISIAPKVYLLEYAADIVK